MTTPPQSAAPNATPPPEPPPSSPPPPAPQTPARTGTCKLVLFAVFAVVMLLFIIEGCSSFTLFAYDSLLYSNPSDTIKFRQYDPTIGWVNQTGVHSEDYFGPGASVTLNAQGFRQEHEVPTQTPPGKVRILCSGDSFTFGTGVDTQQTWVSLLATLNGRIDPVNMGTEGFGVDQTYLWYLRDGQTLDHDIHLFAFISHNFDRMVKDTFSGYPKSVVKLVDGQLETLNVPVPRSGRITRWLAQNPQIFQQFSTLRLMGKFVPPKPSEGGGSGGGIRLTEQEMHQTVRAIVEELKRVNQEKSSTLILVHVPTRLDYNSNVSGPIRRFLRETCDELSVPYLDLIEDLRQLDHPTMDKLYLTAQQVKRLHERHHFTVEGNRYMARLVYEHLSKLPEVKSTLLRELQTRGEGDNP